MRYHTEDATDLEFKYSVLQKFGSSPRDTLHHIYLQSAQLVEIWATSLRDPNEAVIEYPAKKNHIVLRIIQLGSTRDIDCFQRIRP